MKKRDFIKRLGLGVGSLTSMNVFAEPDYIRIECGPKIGIGMPDTKLLHIYGTFTDENDNIHIYDGVKHWINGKLVNKKDL